MKNKKVEIVLGGLRMELKSKDVVFVVSDDGGKYGELRVSSGSVDWWPPMKRVNRSATRLGWEKFAETMQEAPSNVSRLGTRRPVRARRTTASP